MQKLLVRPMLGVGVASALLGGCAATGMEGTGYYGLDDSSYAAPSYGNDDRSLGAHPAVSVPEAP